MKQKVNLLEPFKSSHEYEKSNPKVKTAERLVFKKALEDGVPARAEIAKVDQAKYYLDMGVRHSGLGTDIGFRSTGRKNRRQLKKCNFRQLSR